MSIGGRGRYVSEEEENTCSQPPVFGALAPQIGRWSARPPAGRRAARRSSLNGPFNESHTTWIRALEGNNSRVGVQFSARLFASLIVPRAQVTLTHLANLAAWGGIDFKLYIYVACGQRVCVCVCGTLIGRTRQGSG